MDLFFDHKQKRNWDYFDTFHNAFYKKIKEQNTQIVLVLKQFLDRVCCVQFRLYYN